MSPRAPDDGPDGEGERPVVRDRRRLDPQTGEVRAGVARRRRSAPRSRQLRREAAVVEGASADAQLAELTADLQRVQAEYANYRRRVERDRQLVGETALASVFATCCRCSTTSTGPAPTARSTGGFALVADGLETTLAKLGLERFGDAGEPFDPTVHEALTHGLFRPRSPSRSAPRSPAGLPGRRASAPPGPGRRTRARDRRPAETQLDRRRRRVNQ